MVPLPSPSMVESQGKTTISNNADLDIRPFVAATIISGRTKDVQGGCLVAVGDLGGRGSWPACHAHKQQPATRATTAATSRRYCGSASTGSSFVVDHDDGGDASAGSDEMLALLKTCSFLKAVWAAAADLPNAARGLRDPLHRRYSTSWWVPPPWGPSTQRVSLCYFGAARTWRSVLHSIQGDVHAPEFASLPRELIRATFKSSSSRAQRGLHATGCGVPADFITCTSMSYTKILPGHHDGGWQMFLAEQPLIFSSPVPARKLLL